MNASVLPPEIRRELEALRDQLQLGLTTVEQLLAGPPQVDQRVINLYRTEAIIWVLDHDKLPMSPVQITRRLHELGRNDPQSEVQVTTYDLWKQGRLTKLSRGVYCSNNHVPAGVPRFVPSRPSGT
jgi:hypothetical protein